MPEPITVIAVAETVGLVIGLITDTEGIHGMVTGDSGIEIDEFPESIDMYVGDSAKIEYDVKFTFVNSLLSIGERVVFELRFFKDGVPMRISSSRGPDGNYSTKHAQVIRRPSDAALNDESGSIRLQGQLWFGARSYDCNNVKSNRHDITLVASILDIRNHNHHQSVDRVVKYRNSRQLSPRGYKKVGESGNIKVYSKRFTGPQLLKLETRQITVRIHNPYYWDNLNQIQQRNHHTGPNCEWAGKAKVNYRLSSGSHQILRPSHAETNVLINQTQPLGWTIQVPQGIASSFRLTPPQDSQAFKLVGTHDGEHHPNTESVCRLGVVAKVSGKNKMLTNSSREHTFQWSTQLLDSPNTSTCTTPMFTAHCTDPHEHGLYKLDEGCWWNEDGVYACFTRDEQAYRLIVEGDELYFFEERDLHTLTDISIEIPISLPIDSKFQVSLHPNTSSDWSLKTMQVVNEKRQVQNPELLYDDSLQLFWSLPRGTYAFHIEGVPPVVIWFKIAS